MQSLKWKTESNEDATAREKLETSGPASRKISVTFASKQTRRAAAFRGWSHAMSLSTESREMNTYTG